MFRYLSVLIYLFIINPAFAQSELSGKYNTIHYTLKEGLSQVSINDILQDDEGYLWIATQDGLNRFDGSSFLVFRYNNEDKNSICGNFINDLLLDDDRLWIGTRSSGLSCYDIKSGIFRNFSEFSGSDIISLGKDRYHNIFVSFDNNKIAVIHRTKGGKYAVKLIPVSDRADISTTDLYIAPDGTIWAGAKTGQIFKAKENTYGEIRFSEIFGSTGNIGKINVIKSIEPGILWIGTRIGLYRFNTTTNILVPFELTRGKSKSGHLIIYDIEWKDGDMWVATGSGLYMVEDYTKNKRHVVVFKHKELNTNSISNNTVTGILMDREGQVWVGTGKFLNLMYSDPIVNVIKSEAGNSNTLNSNVIFAIRKINDDLLIGTSGGGFNLVRNGRFYSFTKETHYLPSNVIFSTVTDKYGNIWLGTKEGLTIIKNIDRYPQNMKVENVFNSTGDGTSLSNNFIRQIYRDKNDNIWLCTYDGGLNLFTGSTEDSRYTFRSFRHNSTYPNSVLADRVYCIRQTGDREYWVGTIKGLAVMTYGQNGSEDPHFNRLMVNGKPFLNNNVIYDILVSQNGDKWIGTRNGLYRYSEAKGVPEHFTQERGMPNNVVYGILEDNSGNIWASTNNGIACYNIRTKQFTNYSEEDGLADKEFNLQARFRDNDGTLYFGGINGISFFRPERMHLLDRKNKLYFNGILVTNYKTNRLEKSDIKTDEAVKLRSNQFPFYVNFSNINLIYHKNTNFAYRLKPDDKQWNLIGQNRRIQFLNLAPGNYTLEIQGVSRGKVWEAAKPLKLSIQIVPPWWKSGYALLGYMILFLVVTYIVYKFNIKRNLEHHEKLRLMEIDKLKTNFYTNVTHELRTPLTVILGITEDINDNLSNREKEKYSNKLNVLTRNSKKLLLLINQILDLSKIEKNKLVLKPICSDVIHFLKIITESFHSLAKHKNIEFVYYNEIDNLCMDFDKDKFSIVISNLVSNAIKFTNEYGKVILHVKSENEGNGNEILVVKVKDSGIGINAEDKENIFNRFFQVKRQGDGNEEGTGIGLAIVKEYTELMGGIIDVESTPDKGTVFTVRIPVSRKAPREEMSIPAVTGIDVIEKPENDEKQVDLNAPLLLIVEDNKDVANYIASCIEAGYQVMFARNGNEGIEKAVKYVPDIIITDLMMPDKDGFELCNTLKNNTATSHIPIIMLTARSLEQDKLKGYSSGADAYLIKPFNKKELLVRIKQLTELRKKLQQKYSGMDLPNAPAIAEDEFLKKAFAAIDKNLDDSEYRSADLASDMNLSESQLYRKIKALTNTSTALFIRNYRLAKAKDMLSSTDLNISEIAYRCGFSDPAWFTNSFKAKYKVPPTKYRN